MQRFRTIHQEATAILPKRTDDGFTSLRLDGRAHGGLPSSLGKWPQTESESHLVRLTHELGREVVEEGWRRSRCVAKLIAITPLRRAAEQAVEENSSRPRCSPCLPRDTLIVRAMPRIDDLGRVRAAAGRPGSNACRVRGPRTPTGCHREPTVHDWKGQFVPLSTTTTCPV